MKKMTAFVFLVTLAIRLAAAAETTVIRSAADLAAATFDTPKVGSAFEFDAIVSFDIHTVLDGTFAIQDGSGAMILRHIDAPTLRIPPPGTRVHVQGLVERGVRSHVPFARCRKLSVLGPGVLLPIAEISGCEFVSGRFDCRPVSVVGNVRDVFPDEIDRHYVNLVLDCDGETIYMSIAAKAAPSHTAIVGARIRAQGLCIPSFPGGRRHIGRFLSGSYQVLTPPPTDPFDAPELKTFSRLGPSEIARLGRHRISGRVLAAWHGDTALLKSRDGRTIKIEFSGNTTPEAGSFVEAVGFPASDLYSVNLTRAIWHPAAPSGIATDEQEACSPLTNAKDEPRYNYFAHGRTISFSGIVRNLPGEGNDDGRFNLESGRFIVPIDVSSCPEALSAIGVGYGIEVSGVCVMETENWRPNAVFPRIKGFALVVRRPDDIRVISRPSWWTPSHTLSVVGTLLTVLVAILIWNLLLRRAVERRSRALEKEITARIGSDLKVYERTRLAVELHDSLAQNLSGVSLEIDAASDFAKENPNEMMKHLGIASSALKSCRDELRNCLWDLRNQSLEDEDMDTAIRRTLTPHLAGAKLSVRFNVPRTRLPDNVAHAILRIIRELTVNAVRHGRAKDIKVAGCIEDGHLLLSVRDNGCGFDPDDRPGVEQGHYGLQGISERAEDLDGDMTIESKPGHGTKVTVRIDATPNTKAGNER